jgi:hypothetical protein
MSAHHPVGGGRDHIGEATGESPVISRRATTARCEGGTAGSIEASAGACTPKGANLSDGRPMQSRNYSPRVEPYRAPKATYTDFVLGPGWPVHEFQGTAQTQSAGVLLPPKMRTVSLHLQRASHLRPAQRSRRRMRTVATAARSSTHLIPMKATPASRCLVMVFLLNCKLNQPWVLTAAADPGWPRRSA